MPHYKKSDVDLHPHNSHMVPAVNVKVRYSLNAPGPNYNNSLSQLLAAVRRDIGTEDSNGNDISWVTAEWLDAHLINPAATWRTNGPDGWVRDNTTGDAAEKILIQLEEWACQIAWEDSIQEDARECFPTSDFREYDSRGNVIPFRVESEGRSGGWAVIPALPPLEEWDAVMLARWRKFEILATAGAADIPYQMLHDYLSNYAHAHMLRLTRERLGVSDPVAVHA